MFFREKQKSSQRKIHKSPAKQFIKVPLKFNYHFYSLTLISAFVELLFDLI